MSNEEFQSVSVEEARAALAGIGPNAEDRYDFPNRQPPAGYVTLRDCWHVADVHPSWLRQLVSKGGLAKHDVKGAPAVIKNIRGTWAIRIDALQSYDETKRTPGEGTGAGAGYKYEPQVLKCVKRAVTAIGEYSAAVPDAEIVKAGMEALAEYLKELWEAGKIGKEAEDEGEEGEAPEAEADEDEDEDLDFDFDFDEG